MEGTGCGKAAAVVGESSDPDVVELLTGPLALGVNRIGTNPPRNMFSTSSATLTRASPPSHGDLGTADNGLGLSALFSFCAGDDDGVSGESVITGGGGGGRGRVGGGAAAKDDFEGELIAVGAALEGSVPIGGGKEKGG